MNRILESGLDDTYFEGITENGVMYTIFSTCEWVNDMNTETKDIVISYRYSFKNKYGAYVYKEKSYVIAKGKKKSVKINRWKEISKKYCNDKLCIVIKDV